MLLEYKKNYLTKQVNMRKIKMKRYKAIYMVISLSILRNLEIYLQIKSATVLVITVRLKNTLYK